MITKKNIKRLYYMRVVLFIFHLRATYNIFLSFFNSILSTIEVAVFLVFIFVIYVLLVLILSRLIIHIIIVIQAASNVVKVRINLYVSTLDAENRRRVFFVSRWIILMFPTFLVCCFFWKEVYQEAFLGYTNLVFVSKILYNIM